MPKIVRNSLISFVSLVVVLLLLGILYVYMSGSSAPKSSPKQSATTETTPGAIKPQPPNPNTPESAAVESITSSVAAGQNVALLVRTKPTSTCTPSVMYGSVASTDSGLAAKKADAYGSISWTWTVGQNIPPGKYSAKVTCVFAQKSAVVEGPFQVVPEAAVNNQNQ
jgi:hypothetical protein